MIFSAKTPPHLFTLVLLAGFSPMALNMFLPSLANIAIDFDTDYATASWSLSGYLVITALIQIIIGPLSDRIGRRPVLLAALLLFVIASLGCTLATGIEEFLFFRILQGGIASGYTLSLAIVRDTRSEQQALSLIGYIGMAMAVAPITAPILGGGLDIIFGWRAVFVFYTLAGIGLLILCYVDLGETKPKQAADGNAPMQGAMGLLREPLFWAYALCGAFSVGAFYIFLTGAPLVASATLDVTPAELGLYIGSITVGFMFGGFLAGRFGDRFETATLMFIGRIIACSGLFVGIIGLSLGIISPQLFFASTIFVGLGNGITTPGSNTGAISVRPELSGTAAGLASALMVGLGAVLTALTGVLIEEFSNPMTLLALMLLSSGIGLGCAVWAMRLKTPKTSE